ncbi:hypothetical protein RchiOBHm_Chr6g0271431 [Rosa chinensis]|uniref:Uncharacterized protein n=1 Tax=Rosa chinensis TaxID=74649 RepID=A0A2P6PQY5_ROSCH|nr:hypothetical protein RchiOBHm_Chr6g0271431 [Rosa chinensis]
MVHTKSNKENQNRLQGIRWNYTMNGMNDKELETLILNLKSNASIAQHKVEGWRLGRLLLLLLFA